MIPFALKLILAHTIGDFLFQPDKWVMNKMERKHLSPYLYLHIFIHALALVVLLQFQMHYWLGILIILVTHFLIDLLKINLTGKWNPRLLFGLDQILHLLVIAVVVHLYFPFDLDRSLLLRPPLLLFLISVILLTSVSAILMKLIMSKWILVEDKEGDSLPNAGKYIGILERLFVFGFIVLQQWEAIGLLITAKSVFRFSDLSRAKDRKLTEYILIGTLLSFGLAILIGLAYLLLKDYLRLHV